MGDGVVIRVLNGEVEVGPYIGRGWERGFNLYRIMKDGAWVTSVC